MDDVKLSGLTPTLADAAFNPQPPPTHPDAGMVRKLIVAGKIKTITNRAHRLNNRRNLHTHGGWPGKFPAACAKAWGKAADHGSRVVALAAKCRFKAEVKEAGVLAGPGDPSAMGD